MPTPVETVEKFFKLFSHAVVVGDTTEVKCMITPDFQWWTGGVGFVNEQIWPSCIAVHRVIRLEKGFYIKILGTVTEGNSVAAEAESFCELEDGAIYNNHYHYLVVVEEDRVKLVKEYHDTKHSTDVWERYWKRPDWLSG